MSSPMSTQLDGGNASASLQSIRRLALTSFWLALSPIVPFGLIFVLYAAVSAANPAMANSGAILVGEVVLYSIGPIASISAIVTGIVALIRAGRYQSPQQTRKAFAGWGVALGVVGLVTLCGLIPILLVASSCRAGC
jgi:hypothetical protein